MGLWVREGRAILYLRGNRGHPQGHLHQRDREDHQLRAFREAPEDREDHLGRAILLDRWDRDRREAPEDHSAPDHLGVREDRVAHRLDREAPLVLFLREGRVDRDFLTRFRV